MFVNMAVIVRSALHEKSKPQSLLPRDYASLLPNVWRGSNDEPRTSRDSLKLEGNKLSLVVILDEMHWNPKDLGKVHNVLQGPAALVLGNGKVGMTIATL